MTELKKKINYMVACVREFSDRYNLTEKEAFNYLYDHQGIAFLKEFYDIEHTLSFEDTLDALAIICRKHGGKY